MQQCTRRSTATSPRLPPLNGKQRRLYARCALSTCALALALLPLTSRVESRGDGLGARGARAFALPDVPGALTFPQALVRHDPFAERSGDAFAADDDDAPDFVLPPNAAADAVPVVRAIVMGNNPRALVDIGGRTVIVRAGGLLGETKIVRIDADGVLLENGNRIVLDQRP